MEKVKKYLLPVIILTAIIIYFFATTGNETTNMQTLKITSSAFEDGGKIPAKYTCDDNMSTGGINPPFAVEKIPQNAKSLVLIMDDPDAPVGVWDHWVVWNIPITGNRIYFEEGQKITGIAGKNSSGKLEYQGPCPPNGEHRYFLKIYALDSELNLPEGSSKKEVETAMKGHILAEGELMGKYDRTK